MKTLRRLVALVVLVGSYQLSMAQNKATPMFRSDAEKQAWIDANPEAYAEIKGTTRQFTAEEKKVHIQQHPDRIIKTDVKVVSGMKFSGQVGSTEMGEPALKEKAILERLDAKKVKSTIEEK